MSALNGGRPKGEVRLRMVGVGEIEVGAVLVCAAVAQDGHGAATPGLAPMMGVEVLAAETALTGGREVIRVLRFEGGGVVGFVPTTRVIVAEVADGGE